MLKSKAQLKDKYLKQVPKSVASAQRSTLLSRATPAQVSSTPKEASKTSNGLNNSKIPSSPNACLEEALALDRGACIRSESSGSVCSEDRPLFVETEESRALGEEGERIREEVIYGRYGRRGKGKEVKEGAERGGEGREKRGQWVVREGGEEGGLGKRQVEGEEGESDEESSSSGDSQGRPRQRHDSSDSDIEMDSEEVVVKREEKEKAFKHTLAQALGMNQEEIERVEKEKILEKEGQKIDDELEDSDISLNSDVDPSEEDLMEKVDSDNQARKNQAER